MGISISKTTLKRMSLAALFMLLCLPYGLAQSIKVTGKVTDSQDEPLIGVSVIVKGTKTGSITDVDGNYTISAEKGAVLVFSYVGYTPQEKKIVDNHMNVVMQESNQALNDLVVVGYGVQKKSSVTGAISQVKEGDIQNRTITNPQSASRARPPACRLSTPPAPPARRPQSACAAILPTFLPILCMLWTACA